MQGRGSFQLLLRNFSVQMQTSWGYEPPLLTVSFKVPPLSRSSTHDANGRHFFGITAASVISSENVLLCGLLMFTCCVDIS